MTIVTRRKYLHIIQNIRNAIYKRQHYKRSDNQQNNFKQTNKLFQESVADSTSATFAMVIMILRVEICKDLLHDFLPKKHILDNSRHLGVATEAQALLTFPGPQVPGGGGGPPAAGGRPEPPAAPPRT